MNGEKPSRGRSSPAVFALAFLAASAALFGVFMASKRPTDRAAEPPQLSRLQRTVLSDIFRGAAGAARAWPGYDPLAQPLLAVLKGEPSVLVGSKAAPRGFRPVLFERRPAHVSGRAFDIGFMFNTDYALAGTRATAIQASKFSGPEEAVVTLFHESFHDAQSHGLFKITPRRRYAVEEPEDIVLAAAESYNLGDWVMDGSTEALHRFAAYRTYRRAKFPGSLVELWDERIEGTANYVELAAYEAFASTAAARDRLAAALRSDTTFDDMSKQRHYRCGAALCRALESLGVHDWRRQVEQGMAPSELLIASLALKAPEMAERLKKIRLHPKWNETLADARRDIEKTLFRRAGILRAFEGQKGTLLSIPRGGPHSFHGSFFEYPDGSQIVFNNKEWTIQGAPLRLRLSGGSVRQTGYLTELFLPPGTVVALDGVPWKPAAGRTAFKTLSLVGPGLEAAGGPGTWESDGRRLTLRLDAMMEARP